MARVPFSGGMRAHYALTLTEYLDLPIRLRDDMLRDIEKWRAQEDSGKPSQSAKT